METIRIFGGKPSAEEQAVDIEAVPLADVRTDSPAKTERAKKAAFWGFVLALAIVVGSSVFYMMMRTAAHAEANPIPPPPRPLAPKVPGVEATGAVVPVETKPDPAPLIDPPAIGETKPTVSESQPAPAPAAAPAAADPSAKSQIKIGSASETKPLERPVIVEPPPGPPIRVKTADKPVEGTNPIGNPVDIGKPELGKWYLQLGSLEKGVAEVIVQGLKTRGIHAVWGPGVSSHLGRILVGPYDSIEQAEGVRKQVEELGFSKPFPKRIGPEDLGPGTGDAALAPKPLTPARTYAPLPEK